MVRRLILMRHAKSSWKEPAPSDHARPLNRRGRASAAALGDWLRSADLSPDQALSSSSLRTRQTFDGLALTCPVAWLDALYHAGPEEMMQVLRRATGATVLMLGHNPGIASFAARLLRVPPDHPRFEDYPTGATLVARFESESWEDVDWASGVAEAYVVPRDLRASPQ